MLLFTRISSLDYPNSGNTGERGLSTIDHHVSEL
jgi:hypothetical protein